MSCGKPAGRQVGRGNDVENQPLLHWVIRAAEADLMRACSEVALDPNAVRREDPMPRSDYEGALTFPSFFCPEPQPWLAVLSRLVLCNAPLRLAVESVDAQGKVLGMMQIFPAMDAEMLDLLQSFSAPDAAVARDLTARVERAFDVLQQQIERDGGDQGLFG